MNFPVSTAPPAIVHTLEGDLSPEERVMNTAAHRWIHADSTSSLSSDDLPTGFVLACEDHERRGEETQSSPLDALQPSPRSCTHPVWQMRAHKVACHTVKALNGDTQDVFVFHRQRNNMAHFGLVLDQNRYFAKARLGEPQNDWPEKRYAQVASERGFGLPVKETPTLPNLLLTPWIGDGTVRGEQMQSTKERSALLRRVRAIHALPLEPHAKLKSHDAWPPCHYLEKLERDEATAPLDLFDLKQRVRWIQNEFLQLDIQPSFVHGDVALPNIVLYQNLYYFIDWESAGAGDAFRDPARLISYAQWDNKRLLYWLETYLGRAATPKEIRHFGLVVAEFDLGHYANERLQKDPDIKSYTARARRVADGLTLLPDMPPVRFHEAEEPNPCP